ncbi:hypothetical protein CACET_c03410 [Clostridium aceticum]|uniref:Uncharacterized protein n=1 Tax=Clostridium aceticum TaxID=84022 RepID=A0A0G3W7G9_9CLOT|nr:hypothetical protein [Clostridium aceticum]AKL93857.1 hypothetical protein CACET_c03410 [Clostridium aceticum]
MEMLSWMKKVDRSMEKKALLELIDEMHGVIQALLEENKESKSTIQKLAKESQQQ